MGSELQLTGLASGFDWAPVVDQLIELERVPQNRLIAEKQRNEEKISDLDLLKSQLDALNSSSKALQDEDLFQARKVGAIGNSSGLVATAKAGAITGEFEISVESLATKTEMSSSNRSSKKLGGGIDPTQSLQNLPLHTAITEGTFTIDGRTFNITSLNMTLQDLLDDINAQVSTIAGVNPENDSSAVTVSYEALSDKIVIDSGEKLPGADSKLPVLGSSTDTSNFLQAMRLLSRTTEWTDADIEAGSGVSTFNAGDESKAWLRSGDVNSFVSPGDPRSYAEFNGKLYERVSVENQYDSNVNYTAGDRVYNQGFLYEAVSAIPSTNWDGTQINIGDMVRHGAKSYELLVDLETYKIDSFSSVDSGSHLVNQATNPSGTVPTSAYKAGDVVKAADGSFFRSIKDRFIAGSVDWSGYSAVSGYSTAIGAQGWTDGVPQTAYMQGRAYQLTSETSAVAHGGSTDTTLYGTGNGWGTASKLVFGQQGTAVAESNYYSPVTSAWDQVGSFSATDNYQSGDIVLSGGQFLQANTNITAAAFNAADWTDVTSDINDLGDLGSGNLVDSFWAEADLSITNDSYWSEIAQANGRDDFDSNYWQEVAPEMNRFDSTGAGNALTSVDYSLWAHVGAVGSYAGDGIEGNRDAFENGLPNDSNFNYDAWSGSANVGDYVQHNGKVFEATSITTNEPGILGSEGDWNLIADSSTISAVSISEQANKSRFTDAEYWSRYDVPPPGQNTGHWSILQEKQLTSSSPLGNLDLSATLANANFSDAFTGLTSGLGNFFIGEGEGAVRIDYDVNNDTLSTLIDRVNRSEANIDMYYDPVSDRFVLKNKTSGSIGIVLHESDNWDTLSSANVGAGNLLNLMGLAAPSAVSDEYDTSVSYEKGDLVKRTEGTEVTYWQAHDSSPSDKPSSASAEWKQIILGVGRSFEEELGENSIVRVNGGERVYSTKTEFSQDEHGYEGITFDVANVSIGGSASFAVAKDATAAKKAIDKFIEEFNDAQDYIDSLVSITNDGDNVTAGRFSSNLEISRLGGQLRKIVFGDSTAHSESGTTTDGSNLVVNSNDGSNTEIDAISTQLNLGASDTGYVIKVLDDNGSGLSAFYKWNGSAWESTTPTYSSFRLSNLGLDFGIGSDNLQVKNSAMLLQALEDEPEKVQALFSEAPVELAFDSNTNTQRKYQGLSYSVEDFITSFLTGDSDSGYKGAYTTHVDSIKSQNERLDDRIEDLEYYLEQREETLRSGFMRMEEMQSKINTQMQTLQSSFNNNNNKK